MQTKTRPPVREPSRRNKNSGKRALSPRAVQGVPATKKSALGEGGDKENGDGKEAPKMDVDFEGWLAAQNLTFETLLTKSVKLGRLPAGKQHQAKLLELGNIIKEFRTAAKVLLAEKKRLSSELQTAKEMATDLEETATRQKTQSDERIRELENKLARLEEKHREAQSYVESLQGYNASLQNEMTQIKDKLSTTENERLKAMEEFVVMKGKNDNLTENLKDREERHNKSLEVIDSKMHALEMGREQDAEAIRYLKKELEDKMNDLALSKEEKHKWKEMAEMYRDKTGQSAEEMERMECTKAALEGQYASQSDELEKLRREIAICRSQKDLSNAQIQQKDGRIAELQIQVEERETRILEVEEKLRKAEDDRKKLHNTIQELKGNIRVFCRVRPVKESEEANEPGTENRIVGFPQPGNENGISCLSVLCPPGPQQPHQEMKFSFDQVFPSDVDQEGVFGEISQLVQSALDGYKVCIFAYGQTGSGKTYTMIGSKENPGVIPRSMEQVFQSCTDLEERGWKFAMHASMIEIYNEEYHDLLSNSASGAKKHTVSHDANGNTTVSDLVLVNVREPGKVDQLLEKALQKRSVGATLLNDQSSRSHFVFALKIEGRHFETGQKLQGVLNLIDLAGSERVKESGAAGARLKEAQNINKSLSALGDVIVALSNKADHIPYRNSKLTWLLQPCLGKESKTLMFVNISPSAAHCHESVCSLRFAAKVNACEIGIAKRNVMQQSSSKN